METVIADEDATFVVEFMEDGDFVVPDVGSVTWLLRGNDGTKISAATAVTTDDTTTQVELLVPSTAHEKAGEIEKRTLVVDYKVNGKPRQFVRHYRVISWLNFAVTVEDVRQWIGVSRNELPDEALDLVRVYYDVKNDAPKLPEALSATTTRQYDANMALIYKAVLQIAPSLQYRISKNEQDDQVSFSRIGNIDFEKLKAHARHLYSEVVRSIQETDDPTGPTLFTLAAPADPITGGT